MSEKFKCSVCGKEVEYDGGLAVWASKNPDKVTCPECHAKKKEGAAAKAKEVGASKTAYSKPALTAKQFKKVYDEFKAEFADIMDEVSPFLGGWVSTVILNSVKKGK